MLICRSSGSTNDLFCISAATALDYRLIMLELMHRMSELGPLTILSDSSKRNNVTLELNPNSLTKVANVIFVDEPAGVGFSYATTYEGTKSSDSILALHSYQFLTKWVLENPRFQNHQLYISGISYMGLLVPMVALEAYKGNEDGNQPQLNIKGYLIISPLTDKFIDFNSRFEYAHRFALISDDIYKSTKEACGGKYIYNDANNILCSSNLQRVDEVHACLLLIGYFVFLCMVSLIRIPGQFQCISGINLENILEPLCDDADPEPPCVAATNVVIEDWANEEDVQKALHVREGTIETWKKNNETMHYYFEKNDTTCYSYDIFSTIVYHKQLVSRNCQVLIISGDHDMTFPYVGTEEWIKSLNVPIESPWNPWFVDNQVAGYQMTYGKNGYSLTYATVKGAGHSVAFNKPEEFSALVYGWLDHYAYISDS
ncbi:putative peptidase S10, serine carboxypeptidase, alpha/Beta hydrolase [Helianthus annuus]|nr:putative peptidase S10, serine carboxypeptidase, alpha/Beta hydrolase [Helianthus annuus]